MSRSLFGGVVGGVIGYFVSGGNPAGASYGYAIGSGVGGALDVAATRINRQGPRLGDAQTQTSAYGGPITRLYGTDRLSGSVEYLSARREVSTSTTERQGKGGPKVTTTTYSYYVNAVVSIVDCQDGPITGVRRMWGNSKLFYSNASDANINTVVAGTNIAGGIRFYTGTQDQLPDPLLEAVYGIGNVPGFRGAAYVVFEDFKLDDFFGVLPQIEFEVVKAGSVSSVLQYGPTVNPAFGNTNAVSYSSIPADGSPITFFKEDGNTGTAKVIQIYSVDQNGGALTFTVVANPSASYVYTRLKALADIDAICYRVIDPIVQSDVDNANVLVGPDGEVIQMFLMGAINAYGQGSSSWAKYGDRVLISGDNNQFIDGSSSVYSGGFARLFVFASGALVAETNNGSTNIPFSVIALTPTWAWLFWLDTGTSTTYLRILNATTGAFVGDYVVPSRLGNPQLWRVEQNADDTLTVLCTDGLIGLSRFLMVKLRPNATMDILATENVPSGPGSNFAFDGTSRSIRVNGLTVIGGQAAVPGSANGIGVRQWVFRFSALENVSTTLSTIVSAECAIAGLSAGDIDVTELTDSVLGFKLTRNGGVRGGLEALQRAYYFDIIESAGKIKFPKRGRAVSLTIPYADMGAGEGQAQPDPLPAVRSQDLELPVQVAVAYINPAADYQPGTEVARRLTTPGQAALTLEIPVVMTAAKAAQCAEAAIYEAHASRTVRRVSVSRKYSALEAADVVNLTDKSGNLIRSRLGAVDSAGPVITLDTVEDDGTVWTQTVAGAAGTVAQTGIVLAPTSVMLFLDIPILQDSDNEAGLYVKLRPTVETGWRGAVLFREGADGDRVEVGTVLNVPSVGVTTTALPTPPSFGIVDDSSSVTVTLATGDAESITHAALMEGLQGAWIIGNEIVQVRTATFVSGTTWVLSGFLRGIRGTEWAAGAHVIGERAAKLDAAGMLRVPLEAADIGQPIKYTAVSIGRTVAGAQSVNFTNTAIGLKPFAPVNLRGSRASGDWTISWDRRSRLRYSNPPSGDIALGEASELYDVLVYSSSGFTTVTRSFLGVTSATQIYTSAQQTTDFGSAQATIYIGVFQRSAVVGRGYELRGSLAG